MTLSASQLVDLLRQRHAADVFVAECKNGPTHSPLTGLLKLDAWVVRKTWSPWSIVGYEVKVDRQDFERDQKWSAYLPLCHEFYFVCPGGLIRGVDLPPGIGLLWASQNGGRLWTKVKAARHEPDSAQLCQLMSYVLMSRTVIVGDMHQAVAGLPMDRLSVCRREVERADERKSLAMFVGEHVRRRQHEAGERLLKAESLTRLAQDFARRLAQLGITWNPESEGWSERWHVQTEIDALVSALDAGQIATLRSASRHLSEAVALVESLRMTRMNRDEK